jgi:Hg(II)-responsive transcriptional regulator
MSRKNEPNNKLTIGALSKKSGVGIEAIRFYERKGLLPKPQRTPSGYRQFTTDTVDRLIFISRAKKLGFTLDEIKDLLMIRLTSNSKCTSVRKKAESKIYDIEEKIGSLQSMKRALRNLVNACAGRTVISECPIWRL